MAIFVKPPGWNWEVDYESDGERDTMIVFGQIRIEDAIVEARRSLSFNFFDDPQFVEPAIIGAKRT